MSKPKYQIPFQDFAGKMTMMEYTSRDEFCEGCEDEEPLRKDPITGLLYHVSKDPIGGRTYQEVCTRRSVQSR